MAGKQERAARNRKIVRLYADGRGRSTGEIAKAVGVSQSRVQQILTEAGAVKRSNGRPLEDPRNRARNDRIERMYTERQLSSVEIAERLGMSVGGVMGVLRSRRIERRPTEFYPKPLPASYHRHREYAQSIAKVVGTGPGFSAAELARKAKMRPDTLRIHLRALGVWMRNGVSAECGGRLNVGQVRRIKSELMKGATQMELAKKYKVGRNTIYAIAAGESWVDVPWPGEGRV